jgi:hypothetical protein
MKARRLAAEHHLVVQQSRPLAKTTEHLLPLLAKMPYGYAALSLLASYDEVVADTGSDPLVLTRIGDTTYVSEASATRNAAC